MRDSTTVLTTKTLPSPAPQAPAANRVRVVPTKKLTRAHLGAALRPALMQGLAEAAGRVATALGRTLGCPVSCTARLNDATLHPFSHLAARALFVTVELGGDTLAVLELDLLTAGALLKHIAGSAELPVAPLSLSRIEEAALGWVCLAALSALRQELALAEYSPRLVSLTLERGDILQQLDSRRRHVAVQLELGVGETRGASRLLLPAQWLQAKLAAQADEPVPAPCDEVLAADLPLRCFAGWALLAPADAAALSAGDVVLFSGFTRGADGLVGPGRLVGSTFELRGAFSDAGFTLTRASERPTQEQPMSAADPTVPVEVEVELTRVRVPLDKLGLLRPGHVIPLHVNAAQHVVLRIGDRAVARAELVEIEGELGARLVSML